MKTKIIDILNTIANNEQPPKLILFKDRQWSYDEKEKDYVNIFNEWLFDGYVISNIVNCEVEILEITITLKQDKKIENISEEEMKLWHEQPALYDDLAHKVKEIIEVLNNE